MCAARLTNASAPLRCKGESPLLNSSLLNSVLAELAAQGTWARERAGPVEGFTSRSRHCLGGFRRLPREISGG
jgi:hypothetical protein